jgi:hypothetical protein
MEYIDNPEERPVDSVEVEDTGIESVRIYLDAS